MANPTQVPHDIEAPPMRMNARQYRMLMNGKDENLEEEIATNFSSNLRWLPEMNTVLHIAASAGHSHLIPLLLAKDQSLVDRLNSNHDLPIHVAIRAGHKCFTEELVKVGGVGQLSRGNKENSNALHLALEMGKVEIGRSLFEKHRVEFWSLNDRRISPLYLAIKAGLRDVVNEMFQSEWTCPMQNSLRNGRSIVHAAIMARDIGLLTTITSKDLRLLDSLDEKGRTTLSYASLIGFSEGVKHLLNHYPQGCFEPDKDEYRSFPIHKACSGGHIEVVKQFLTQSPNTKCLRNKREQNIFHVAAGCGNDELVTNLLKMKLELKELVNKKDRDGNTPLHLAAFGLHAQVIFTLTGDDSVQLIIENNDANTALDIAETNGEDIPTFRQCLTWLALLLGNVPRSAESEERMKYWGKTISSKHCEQAPRRAMNGLYKERINTLLLVATLVSTVTFAASFSVPGGYNSSDQKQKKVVAGMATLGHWRAFHVFVISNTIAMYTSIFAAVSLIWANLDDLKLSLLSLNIALPSLGIALAMMSTAFMSSLYLVLHSVCNWLALTVLIMGSVFLGLLLAIFIPLYFPTSLNRSFVRRFFRFVFYFLLLAYECKG